jgi:hypothetical protein
MFKPETYTNRRNALRNEVKGGIILLPGNTEAAFNYPANTYHFRQDSTFSYFFGINQPDLAGIIDLDNGKDILFGNDVDMDDIIWMGNFSLRLRIGGNWWGSPIQHLSVNWKCLLRIRLPKAGRCIFCHLTVAKQKFSFRKCLAFRFQV